VADQINTSDDRNAVRKFCRELDWSTVVPELVIKPIVHPFRDRHAISVTEQDLALLREWASVRTSVGGSVRASMRDSVLDSVGVSVGNSVWVSVGGSVGGVGGSVWILVLDSVKDLVGASMWDSIRAYVGSFFRLPKWKYIDHQPGEYPFQPAVDLWERGLVPSYDGKVWGLYGDGGKVLWSGTLEQSEEE
jgi:hypothetical protein